MLGPCNTVVVAQSDLDMQTDHGIIRVNERTIGIIYHFQGRTASVANLTLTSSIQEHNNVLPQLAKGFPLSSDQDI